MRRDGGGEQMGAYSGWRHSCGIRFRGEAAAAASESTRTSASGAGILPCVFDALLHGSASQELHSRVQIKLAALFQLKLR